MLKILTLTHPATDAFICSFHSVYRCMISIIIIHISIIGVASAQCPAVTAIGSDKVPNELCAPVSADLEYDVTFTSPPAGLIDAYFYWGDGSPTTVVSLRPGFTVYNVVENHVFPVGDDICEYEVEMILRVNGTFCTATRQVQRVTSWQPDDLAGGEVALQSPQGSRIYEVCAGEDISVIFDDITQFNCNKNVDPDPNLPLTPNEQYRWQQIVYNTATTTAKIPNTSVNGVPVTGALGADVIFEYEDPRGVKFLPTPVEIGDPDRRSTLEITAPGGLGAGFPVVGDEFEVTIKYWNFCNPYDNDITDGNEFNPVNGDLINGDNPPIIATAIIRVVDAPPPPVAVYKETCSTYNYGDLDFEITGTAGSTAINWYDDDPNAGGVSITHLNPNGPNSSTFPVLSVPSFQANSTIGDQSVWATYELLDAVNCESDPVEVVIRVKLRAPRPGAIIGPVEVCNGSTGITFSQSSPAGERNGDELEYSWGADNDITLSSTTGQSITADFNVDGSFETVEKVITVSTVYKGDPECKSRSNLIRVTIYGESIGGTTTTDRTICEGEDSGIITLSGHRGDVLNWEKSVNGAPFVDIGQNGSTSFNEVLNNEGIYEYRAVIKHAICSEVRSSVTTIVVNPIPVKPTISEVGDGLNICENGDRTILQSSNADGNADIYVWYKDPDLTTPVQESFGNQLILNMVSESGTYYVQVVGIEPTNCESELSDPVDVLISPLPAANLTGGGSECNGIAGPPSVIEFTGVGPFNVTYERDGIPITDTNVSSPYTIPGSGFVVDGSEDVYVITEVSDIGAAANCTTTAPSANITGTTTIKVLPAFAPEVQSVDVGPTICDDGVSTIIPAIMVDLLPNSIENYDIYFEIRDESSALILTRMINKNSNAAGIIDFNSTDLNYADLGNLPGNYELIITSIIDTDNVCNAAFPPYFQNIIINPRPSEPTNPLDAISCSSGPINSLSVDDPGDGYTVRWFTSYSNPSVNTPVTLGTTSGNNAEIYTPATTTTATYFAAIEIDATACLSNTAVMLTHTEDEAPSMANADTDGALNNETCNDFYTLSANTPTSGTGYWSSPNLIYFENFNSAADNGAGAEGPGNMITAPTIGSWNVDLSGSTGLTASTDYFKVVSQRFVARDVNGTVSWSSPIIDISASPGVDISVDLDNNQGDLESSDDINVYYSIDGGTNVLFTNGYQFDDFAPITATALNLTGSTVQIIIEVANNADEEEIYFDNISVVTSGISTPIISDINNPNATISNLPIGDSDFTWTISSDLGVCPDYTSTVTVTRHPLPEVYDPNPKICEQQPRNSGNGIANLNDYEDLISNVSSANRNVTWYVNAGLTSIPPDLNNHMVSNGTIVYYVVENTDTGCQNNGKLTFNTITLPETVDQSDINNPLETSFCEETVGAGFSNDINLVLLNDNVANGITSNRTVEWYTDPGILVSDRSDLIGNLITTPANVDNVTDGTRFYSIVQNTITGCEDIAETTITIKPRALANPIIAPDGSTASTYTVCRGTDPLFFQIDPLLNVGSTYHWSIPTDAGELEFVGGGTTSDYYVLVRATNLISSPGVEISVYETTADGCDGDLNTIRVLVDGPPPAPSITGIQEVCNNQQNVTYSIVSPNVGSTYTWNIGPLGSIVNGQGTDEIIVNIGTISSDITVTETNATGCTSTSSDPFPVTVNPRPSMTSTNTVTVCSGTSVDLELTFTSDIPATTYSWVVQSKSVFLGGTVVGDSGSGDINRMLTNVSNTVGTVIFEVTPNSSTPCDGSVQIVTVSVEPEPTATITTTTPEICTSENLDITITTPSSPTNSGDLTFDYSVSSSDVTGTYIGGTAYAGATGQTYPFIINGTLTNTDPSGNDIIVTYTVTPLLAGCPAGADVTLDVIVSPQPLMTSSDNETICSGDSPSLVFSSNVPGSTFAWKVTNISGVSGTNVGNTGANLTTETLTNTNGVQGTVVYEVVPTGPDALNCTGVPQVVTISVDPEPVMTSPNNETICSGDSPSLIFTSNVALSTYLWRVTDVEGVSGTTVGNTGTSLASETLTNINGVEGTVTYEVVPTGPADLNCIGSPQVVTISVDPEPVMTSPNNETICSGDSPALIFSSNVPGSTYTWTITNIDGVSGTTVGNTGSSLTTETLTNTNGVTGTVTYEVVPTGPATLNCVGTPQTVTINVIPEPVMTSPNSMTICSGDLPPIVFTSNVPGSTYEWTVTSVNNVSGTSEGVLGYALTNTSGEMGTVTLVVVPTGPGPMNCEGQPQEVIIFVEPEPVMTSDESETICSGDSPTLAFTSNVPGSTYAWRVTDVNGVSGTNVGNTGTSLTSEILTNRNGVAGTVTYQVVPRGPATLNCTGAPQVVTITVEPSPLMTSPSSETICSGDIPTNAFTSNVPGSTFEFTVTNINNVSVTSGGNIMDYALVNTSGVTGSVTLLVIPTGPAPLYCVGQPQEFTIFVQPEPVMTSSNNETICSGDSPTLSFSSNLPGSTYRWTVNDINGVSGTRLGNTGTSLTSETLTNTNGIAGTVTYEVVPTGPAPLYCVGAPQLVTITVNPEPVMTSPDSETVCSGDSPVLAFTSNVAGTTFEWSVISVNGVTGTSVGNTGNTSLTSETLRNLNGISGSVTYEVVPTGPAALNCVGAAQVVTVAVAPEPVGTENIEYQCSDVSLSYNIQTRNIDTENGVQSKFIYSVSSSDLTNVPPAANRTVPSVDPITDGYVNNTGSDVTITYTITAFSLVDGCEGNPFDVEFVYYSKPKGFNDAFTECSDVALNYDLQTANVDNATFGNGIPSDFIYTIKSSSGSVPPASNRTVKSDLPITDTYTNNTSTPVDITYTVIPISKGTNCSGDPFDVVFTINPEPLGSNATIELCGGGSINFDLQSQVSNGVPSKFYYNVTSSNPVEVPAEANRSASNASTAGISTSYSNTSGMPVLITYQVFPISNNGTNCEGNPFFVTFNIIPGPEGVSDSDSYCSREQINYDIQADNINVLGNNIAGRYTYVVSSNNESIISTPTSLNRTAASDLPITDTYINNSTQDVTVTYTITPISNTGGCKGTPFEVDFVISPTPQGMDDINNPLCSGDAIIYDIQSDNIDLVNAFESEFIYTVESSDPANVPADPDRTIFDASPINTSYFNSTPSPVFITYTITPREVTNNCVGEEFDVRFRINPEPVVNPNLDNVVCSREPIDITLSTDGTSVNASSYNIINVVIPSDLNFTAHPSNALFPQNNVRADYIELDKYDNHSTNSITVQYEVVPVSTNLCEGEVEIIEVVVQPEPVLDATLSPVELCSGSPSMVTLSEAVNSVKADYFNIDGISIPNGITAGSGNATLGNGQPANAIFNDVFINTTGSTQQVVYTIVPVSSTCEGPPQTVIFQILPAPVLLNLNTIMCSNDASGTNITLGTEVMGSTASEYELLSVSLESGITDPGGNATPLITSDVDYLKNDVWINNTNSPSKVTYQLQPISSGGCVGPVKSIVVTVEPEPTVIDPPDEIICSGGTTNIALNSNTVPTSGNVTFDILGTVSSGLVSGYTVVKQNIKNGFVIADGIINNSDDPQTVQYEVIPRILAAKNNAGCSAGSSTFIEVIVQPNPKLIPTETRVTVCENESLDIQLNSPTNLSSGSVTFELTEVIATGGITGYSSLGTVFNVGEVLNDTFDNPTTSNQTVTYQFTPVANGTSTGAECTGEPVEIVVTVTPMPTVTPSVNDIRLCSGDAINVSLPTDVANSIASWTVSENPNVVGQFDGVGLSLFQSLINITSEPQELIYTVRPFLLLDNECSGPLETIKVIIDPIPNVIIEANQMAVCSGEDLTIPLIGDAPNTTFEVTAKSSNPDISGYDDFIGTNGDVLSQTVVNNGNTPSTIIYTITPTFIEPEPGTDVCTGIPEVVVVTVSPPISGEILTDSEIVCIGNSKAVEFIFTGSAPYTVTLDNGPGTTPFQLEDIAGSYSILLTDSETYRLLEVTDFYGCSVSGSPLDEVTIEFREAVANFTINGSKDPDPVTLDFNSGAATVDIAINNYNPQNNYELTIGEDVVPVTGPAFTYTFTKPSEPGGLGFLVELKVEAPETVSPCVDFESFFIKVFPSEPTVIGIASETEGCAPFVVDFSSFSEDLTLSRNVQISSLTWDFDDGGVLIAEPNPTKTFTNSGVYRVSVTGNNGYPGIENEDTYYIDIYVYEKPLALLENKQEVVYIPDDPFRPVNRSQGAEDFRWDWGDGSPIESGRSPEHFYEEEGQYLVRLEAISINNCTDTTYVTVDVENGGLTRIPNAFTPNPNGPTSGIGGVNGGAGARLNDIFIPITEAVEDFRMMIFDRWGNLIFESNDQRVGWDGYSSSGKLLPAGAYVYKVELSFANGQRTTRVGDVTLIR